MMPSKTLASPTCVRLPADVRRDIQREADANQRTLSWTIVNILRQWLAWRNKQNEKS